MCSRCYNSCYDCPSGIDDRKQEIEKDESARIPPPKRKQNETDPATVGTLQQANAEVAVNDQASPIIQQVSTGSPQRKAAKTRGRSKPQQAPLPDANLLSALPTETSSQTLLEIGTLKPQTQNQLEQGSANDSVPTQQNQSGNESENDKIPLMTARDRQRAATFNELLTLYPDVQSDGDDFEDPKPKKTTRITKAANPKLKAPNPAPKEPSTKGAPRATSNSNVCVQTQVATDGQRPISQQLVFEGLRVFALSSLDFGELFDYFTAKGDAVTVDDIKELAEIIYDARKDVDSMMFFVDLIDSLSNLMDPMILIELDKLKASLRGNI